MEKALETTGADVKIFKMKTFYPAGDKEIEHYVSSYNVLDKAGAYGIQSGAAVFVKSIEGDYYNVVGLPIARILQELAGIVGE